jgi:hypothetical protein
MFNIASEGDTSSHKIERVEVGQIKSPDKWMPEQWISFVKHAFGRKPSPSATSTITAGDSLPMY